MQTLLTVVVLLALVGLGALFIARVNAQQTGRMASHRYADWRASMRQRRRRRPHGDAPPGPQVASAPPPSGKPGNDL
ncbi:hypothetical protein [Streptomyces lydicus]|uniref:Uncharacterized protein n=1 Tax=Streptomyces lydicus TaxID=47763 RepID=A0A1D7VWK6_9ACTN|nr:hypothetical protein [Streptomyces lydicus]AOP50888.1 hypothetical protein SL103_00620 [Streptomyces lydicus]